MDYWQVKDWAEDKFPMPSGWGNPSIMGGLDVAPFE